MKWQFIIFGHNEHELPQARQMAEELGMVFKPKLNYKTKKYAVKDREYVAKESGLGVATIEEIANFSDGDAKACEQKLADLEGLNVRGKVRQVEKTEGRKLWEYDVNTLEVMEQPKQKAVTGDKKSKG